MESFFCVSAGKLFCRAGRKTFIVLKNHVISAEHKTDKNHLKENETDITETLQRYNKQVHSKGETLSDHTQVHRVIVV